MSPNIFLFATNQETNLDDIKNYIFDARDDIPFSNNVTENEKIDLKLIFTDSYKNIKDFNKIDGSMILTDDKAPIEYIVGLDVLPFN